MRVLVTVALMWAAISIPVAAALGHALKRLNTVPPVPSVDDWSDERVTDEFMALVAELDWTVR